MEVSYEELMMIDWINSLDVPSCTLVDDLGDLKSGIVIADIIEYLRGIPLKGIQRNIQNKPQAIKNWCIILEELSNFSSFPPTVRPEEFLEGTQRLISLLSFLSTLSVNSAKDTKNASPMTKTSESTMPSTYMHKNQIISPQIKSRFMADITEKPPEKTGYETKPVPEELKENLIVWLENLHILKKNSVDSQVLPSLCTIGVLFCDLINRVEGKCEIIKGIERNPKNRTHALANLNKCLEYLRGLPRMNSRYLWSAKNVIEGDEAVIWGLLEDIRNLYTPIKRAKSVHNNIPRPPSRGLADSSPIQKVIIPKAFLQEKSQSFRSNSNRSYSASMKRSQSKSPSVLSPRISRPSSSKSIKSSCSKDNFYISSEMKKYVIEWIVALGIEYVSSNNPYTDTLQNGVILCDLIRILEFESLQVNPNPRSLKMILDNFDKAICCYKTKHPEIPNSFINNPENLVDNVEIVFAFIYSIMPIYTNSVPVEYQDFPLPYGAIGIRKLEKATVAWIVSLNILQPPPNLFEEILPEIKTGVLLCVIISRVFNIKIVGFNKSPKTEQSCMNNIRKAIEIIKSHPQMSQKFIWNEKDINKGCRGVILGLLEDIRRCSDGLPPRKSGENYHKDGPYLGKTSEKYHRKTNSLRSNLEESFNTTFGSLNSMNGKNVNKSSEIDCYEEWLLHLKIKIPKSLNFMDEFIPEFTTGVLLCEIVCKLENTNLLGIDKNPNTKTSSMQNICKAFNIIKKKSGFPNDLKHVEEQVFLGNGGIIRRIMQSLMKIYKNKQ